MYVSPAGYARTRYSSAPPSQLASLPVMLTRSNGVWSHRGFGDLSPQNQTIASAAASGAGATVSLLVAMGAIGGPVGAAIAGLIGLASVIAKAFGGCGQTCVQASNIANQIEPVLKKNVDTYFASPVRYRSMQLAALNNFDTVWNALLQNCGNPALGDAGRRCISDRQAGACVWKDSGGQCWNWILGYRDPIANDPDVQPDPTPGAQASAGVLSTLGINADTTLAGVPVSDLVVPAILIALAAML